MSILNSLYNASTIIDYAQYPIHNSGVTFYIALHFKNK